jgi:hypothetical protein
MLQIEHYYHLPLLVDEILLNKRCPHHRGHKKFKANKVSNSVNTHVPRRNIIALRGPDSSDLVAFSYKLERLLRCGDLLVWQRSVGCLAT